MRPPSPAQQYWEGIMNNPSYSPGLRAQAQQRYNAEETYRKELTMREQQDYVDQREKWQSNVTKKRDWEMGAPERETKLMLDRLNIEKEKALAQNRPNEAKKLENEIAIQTENLTKMRDEAAVRKQYGQLPPEVVTKAMGESKEKAASAAQSFQAITTARNAINAGAITGFGADARLNWAKFSELTGMKDTGDAVKNTEVFRAAMAPAVASALKATVGSTQISNTDRLFAERAAGGDITLNAQSIRELLDITHRMNVEAIRMHQTKMDALYPDNPQAQALFGVDMPVPQAHVDRLYANPDKKADFDEIYGKGQADRFLKRRPQ